MTKKSEMLSLTPMPGKATLHPVNLEGEVGIEGFNNFYITILIEATRDVIRELRQLAGDIRKEFTEATQAVAESVQEFVDKRQAPGDKKITEVLSKEGPFGTVEVTNTGVLEESSERAPKIVITRIVGTRADAVRKSGGYSYSTNKSTAAKQRVDVPASIKALLKKKEEARDRLREVQDLIDEKEESIRNPGELRARASAAQYAKAVSSAKEGPSFLEATAAEVANIVRADVNKVFSKNARSSTKRKK